MAIVRHTIHDGPLLGVALVRCRPHDHACGAIEYAPRHIVAFPVRGVFVMHHGRHQGVVADACHALFFDPRLPYRVSHPVEGGDDCLSISPSAALLDELAPIDAAPHTHALLPAREMTAPRILWHRISRSLATPLEVEETALDLFYRISASPLRREPVLPSTPRHGEMVEATQLTLASQPGEAWTLAALAKRVHSSPFHLARLFRRLTGMPMHRYHLRARLASALGEVLDTRRDLAAIGLDLGFSSHSHFTETFRRAFGATPSVLRNCARIR